MTEFKVLPKLAATAKLPEAFVDAEFFYLTGSGELGMRVGENAGAVVGFGGEPKKIAACLQARFWSDYARRYLGEKLKKSYDRAETLRLHAEAVKARDTECMWIVWGWDQNDFPHLQGREKYAAAPATPEGCC